VEEALDTYERLRAPTRLVLVGTLILLAWLALRTGIIVIHLPGVQ
jgi:hypothetical protein